MVKYNCPKEVDKQKIRWSEHQRKKGKKMMNNEMNVGYGFNAWTEESLYTNTAEYEEAQGNLAKEIKLEKIIANAERKGIAAEIREMLADGESIDIIGQIVYDYQKPTEKQVKFAENLAEQFGKPAPVPSLQHGFQWFSQFIAYGLEMTKHLPPTEKQLKVLEGMKYCPDCPSQAGMTFDRGQASEFIGKYNEIYQCWKLTRASDETIRQLMTAYKKADTPKTYEYCLQFDEATAQKMIGQLKMEYELLKARSVQNELEEFFRQTFIDDDNEKRKKAEYNK